MCLPCSECGVWSNYKWTQGETKRYEKAWRALTKSQREGLEQIYKPIES